MRAFHGYPLLLTSAGEPNTEGLTTNWAIREIENWLVGPRTKVRRRAGQLLGGGRRQFPLHTADGQVPGFRPWRRVRDDGTSDWPGMARVG